ncbi:unnamed protein product [Didymodactylos carnosus]|uniref:Uncharacterized protein n=1 Tax=Didymodactylos carnosus TaxID=1234261 RepID=A0A8S2MV40_9BILA|nr:unnamed protein product [Didymodactylos carnosus]CAF3967075.1 unnamed protein product [Didymodactylos carnosus]
MSQSYSAIWLDHTGDVIASRSTYVALCKIDPYLKRFRNLDECSNYITRLEETDGKAVLIVSSRTVHSLETLLQASVQLSQIDSVHLLSATVPVSGNDTSQCQEAYDVYPDLQSLCTGLTGMQKIPRQSTSVRDALRHDFAINSVAAATPIPTHVSMTTTSLPASSKRQEAQFMYSYFIREILNTLKSDEAEMVEFCRGKCAGDETQLALVQEFQDYYEAKDAVFWYTRDSFLYRILNKALREQDIEVLYSIRYYIKDLHRQLSELHAAQRETSSEIETVYRGQLMHNEDFDTKIRTNVGGFFSVSSFLSTTRKKELASEVYAGDGQHWKELQSVLFQIDIDKRVNKFPYADISAESIFEEEESETLFSMGAVFRIQSAEEEDKGVWLVKLVLTGEEDKELRVGLSH